MSVDQISLFPEISPPLCRIPPQSHKSAPVVMRRDSVETLLRVAAS